MHIIQLGPFTMNGRLLALLLGAAAGYAVISVIARRSRHASAGDAEASRAAGAIQAADIVMNSLIVGMLAWKLTPALMQPSMLIQSPLKALVMPGGRFGIWIGLALAIIYMLLALWRKRISMRLAADLLALAAVPCIAVYNIAGGWRYGRPTDMPWGISLNDPEIAYHPMNVYSLIIAIALAAIFAAGRMKPGEGRAGRAALIAGGAGSFGLSLLDAESSAGFLFTGGQWSGLMLMVLGLLLPRWVILWETRLERSSRNDPKFESPETSGEGEQEQRPTPGE